MSAYFKEFEVRWSELDPNRHVANYAYTQFMNEVRFSFFKKFNLTEEINKANIGPVVFHEHFYYIKEVRPYEIIKIDLQLKGRSEDYKFFHFAHHLYKESGEIGLYSELYFGWLDLNIRKLSIPPKALCDAYDTLTKTEDFRILTSKDMRAQGVPYDKKLELTR